MKKSFQSDIPANSIFLTFRCQVKQQLFNKSTMLDFKWGDIRLRDNATDFYKALCSTIHLKNIKLLFYHPGIKGLRNTIFLPTAWNSSKRRKKGKVWSVQELNTSNSRANNLRIRISNFSIQKETLHLQFSCSTRNARSHFWFMQCKDELQT